MFNCVQWLSFRQWHHSLLFDIVKDALDVNDSNEGLDGIIYGGGSSGVLVVSLCVMRSCTFKFIVNSYLNLSMFNCV